MGNSQFKDSQHSVILMRDIRILGYSKIRKLATLGSVDGHLKYIRRSCNHSH